MKMLQSFLRLANYFRAHVRDIHVHEKPLRQLIVNYPGTTVIQWLPPAIKAFEALKEAVWRCPALFFVDGVSPVYLHTDACDTGIGAYLFQIRDGIEQPIGFLSKSLSGAELNWSTFEKEGFAIFKALEHFEYILRDIKFTLRTDHRNLLYLNEKASQKVQRWKLAVQQYNFDVEHIPGIDNVVADLYSRLNTIIVMDNHIETVKSTACIPYMLAALTVDSITNDSTLRTLDKEEIDKILRESHNTYIGHGGVERTLTKIQLYLNKEKVYWPSKRFDVKEYIKHCPACQFMSYLKIKVNISPYNVSVSAPMDRINIDTVGPLDPDEDGNTYIIVLIDVFSRFVELFPCKDTSAVAAVKAIIQHIGRYGTPSQILTDNGSQYIAELTTNLLRYVDTRHITIFPYSHEENSIVERANKEVMRHLRAIIFDTQLKSEWSIILPLVQRIINSQTNKTIGTSPASIIFGNHIDLERNIFKPYVDMSSDTHKLEDYLLRLGKAQSRIVAVAQETQKLFNDTYVHNRQEVIGNELTEFDIGSFVLLQFHDSSFVTRRRPSKLSMNYKGPYRVISRNDTIYRIENLVTQEIFEVHVKELRPFHHTDTINPKDIARHAAGEFFVESIGDVQGEMNTKHNRFYKKNLYFKVHWLGYDNSYDSWEPYTELRLNKQFHAYCKSNNLVYLIPTNLED
jgi:hypothetical protein